MSKITDVISNARSAGLLRNFNKEAVSPFVEAVYLPFSQVGTPTLGTDLHFISNSALDYDSATIVGLEVVDRTASETFPGYYPSDGLADSQLNQLMFVACDSAREHIFSIPLHCLVRRLNRGKICPVQLTSQVWQNCYILTTDTSGLSSSNGIWMNVYYFKK
jgi:hypothetical protein